MNTAPPPLLELRGLEKRFPLRRGFLRRPVGPAAEVRAVDGVDLEVARGECLALVGESGSGKTTLGRCALRLLEPTAGEVRFAGRDLTALRAGELRRARRHFQMIFQDPFGSLDPRRRVGATLAEPLEVHRLGARRERRRRVSELLEMVDLPPGAADRFPHEFSGGQRQRIGIARALATGPELVVADEPVSALDLSVRAQVLNLLARLQRRFDLALLFIAHDLALVEHVADRVAVMYRGRIVERAPRADLFARPLHPYTVALLAAVPKAQPGVGPSGDRSRAACLPAGDGAPSGGYGEPERVGPDRAAAGAAGGPAATPPSGCPYRPRCPAARARCAVEAPELREAVPGHAAACHYPGDLEQNPAAPVA